MPESMWSRRRTSPTPRMRGGLRAARPRAARRGRRCAMRLSPASPRVAHRTAVSCPAAAARARTDPHPNDSSSGCAITTSSRIRRSSMPVRAQSSTRRSSSGAAGCGSAPLGGRLAHAEEEVLEVVGRLARADHEHPGRVGEDAERVRRAAGDEGERAGRRHDDLAVDLELDLAVEDVERLVLVDLHVHRRVRRRRHEVLGEAVGAAGLGGARHGGHQGVEEPGRLALVAAADQRRSSASGAPLVVDTALCSICVRLDTAQGSMSTSHRDRRRPLDHLARHPRAALAAAVDDLRARQAGAALARLVLATGRAQALRRAEAARRGRSGRAASGR